MKKFILLSFLLFGSYLYAKINVIVSILPQQTFVKKIGGDKINISLMVKPGNSPHSYEPKPSQMKDISKADIYFTIGVEFEDAWLPRFINQNKQMKVIDLSYGVRKINISNQQYSKNKHEKSDPHIWISPNNVKIIAKNIYNSLIKADKNNTHFYKNNLNKFLTDIDKTDKKIKNILKNSKKNKKFMVFHPSWGYFAKEYNLDQISIEIAGKSPKPKTLAHIITKARAQNIKTIFVQPEFSDKSAKIIASTLNIDVIKISPLARNWSENIIKLAKAIAGDK